MARKLEKGVNDLKTWCEHNGRMDLLLEWNYVKNENLKPTDVTAGSGKKVWWKCHEDHEWKATIAHRAGDNRKCPFCSGKQVLRGFNDLETKFPEIAAEWDYDKNEDLKPTMVTPYSGKKAWWKCGKCGHEWKVTVAKRTIGRGCPECGKIKQKDSYIKNRISQVGSLIDTNPMLAKEWHPIKNGKLSSSDITAGSHKRVWWRGSCGHEWEATIKNRTTNNSGCPYCAGYKVLSGFNDLQTKFPEIAAEWDYDKNEDLKPTMVSPYSDKKVWWHCPFGHSYQSSLSSRCGNQHTGCPVCNKELHTSFPEQVLFYYVKKYFPDAINSDRCAIGMELDVYIPSLKIAIEYDGATWHKNNKHEIKKNKLCKNNNILLIRVREEGLALYDDCCCIVRTNCKSNDSLSKVIRKVLLDIKDLSDIDIDIDRDSALIYTSYVMACKSNSLESIYPEIAAEWHPNKNGNLTPDMVGFGSNKKVWWLGKCNHEWQAAINCRTNDKTGCPYCSNRKALVGFNDLQTIYPEIASEWHPTKNGNLTPDMFVFGSHKKIWWKCNVCGYAWQSAINDRAGSHKQGCPKCGKQTAAEKHSKPVMCVETGIIYKSLTEAGLKTGLDKNHICSCCRGKLKTTGGYHWKYVEL